MEGILLGFGNPLLDISATVPASLLEKYDLKPANAIMAEAKHMPLYNELVQQHHVEYFAGGATQNSMRVAQWMLGVPGAVGYVGGVGSDEYARSLRQAAAAYGLSVHYDVHPDVATGTCAVLVTDKERSMVAHLGASEKYLRSHYDSAPIQQLVDKAHFFYHEAYFLTHSSEVALALAQHASRTRKFYALNISATFLVDFFWDKLAPLLPHTDLIVANETEAQCLAVKLGLGERSLSAVAAEIAALPKENGSRGRTVIFTQGADATIVAQDGRVQLFKPIALPREQLVDTNGAGDSFVGGLLSGLVRRAPLEECINAAHYCAWECIQLSGCALPPKPRAAGPFFLSEQQQQQQQSAQQ